MKNRIILGLLALMLAVGCFGTVRAALADDTIYTEGTLYYKIINESITITGCFGKDEEVEVPNMIAGIPVNTIGTGAFMENEYIKTLKLPDTISKIERDAIREDIYVIYNANTDHPQDYPTDLILGNLDPVTDTPTPEPEPTTQIGNGDGELSDDTPAPATTPAPTEKPTDAGSTQGPTNAPATQKPGTTQPAVTPTPARTPDPGNETPPPNIGEVDVDLTEDDETPAPTEEPVAEVTMEPATAEPAAEASAAPVEGETVTVAPVEPENPVEPEQPVKPAEQPKDLTWLWVTLGGVAVAGGATAGIVAAKKGKKE